MKKILKVSICILILVVFNWNFSFADTGIVNTDAVRLREQPNTSSEIIVNIYQDEKVEILETLDGWYKIKYGEKVGYAKKEYIKVNSSTNQNSNNENKNNTNAQNIVKNNNLNNSTSTQNTNVQNTNIQNTTLQTNSVQNTTTTLNGTQDNPISNESQTGIISNENTEMEKVKFITNSDTNLRLLPSVLSEVNMVVPMNKEVTKIAQINNWIKVTDGSFEGWVLSTKLSDIQEQQPDSTSVTPKTEENSNKQTTTKQLDSQTEPVASTPTNKKGVVNVETANVREKANSKSEIIGLLDYNEQVDILLEEGDWYKINSKEVTGYISKKLINIVDESQISSRSLNEQRKQDDTTVIDQNTNNNLTESLNNNSNNKGQEVVDYAKQFLNYPYVSGGKNPTIGFDCSGFTKYIYSNFGYTLGNTAASQNSVGTEVDRTNLQLGDLILFYDEGKTKIGHTGIYIGNSQFIHSANPSRGVVIDNLNTNSYYNERYISARRIIE